ncbi:hypothetical protein [Streptomyces sp. NPDC046862]|uniref:hypothetical protein n=1 Tax=Streptomyces sp. NPDC046862 TaxID=3154603 RepID=UPI0034560FE5
MKRLARSLCLALVVAVGAAGCASSRPAAPAVTPLPRASALPEDGRLGASAVDLATRSGAWPETERALQSALDRLTRRCMEDHGFSYPAAGVAPLPDPADDAAAAELPRRRKSGYGLASSSAASGRPASAVDRYYAVLSPRDQRRFDLTLFGRDDRKATVDIPGRGRFRVPEQGCEADSRRRLAGSVVLWARVSYTPEAIDNQLADRVPATPEYRSALRVWRACMSARKHTYDSPETAYRALRDQYRKTGATSAFRKRETAVAVADGDCAVRSRLSSTALEVRRELTAELGKDVRRSLNELASYRAAVVARAEETGAAGE